MNEEMPGTGSVDQEVNRRWREQSSEQPSGLLDDRIRAAARQAIANRDAQGGAARRSSRWTRFVPLTAAASVALLAVGLVRLIPREEYQASPGPDVARQGEARVPASRSPAEAELPADQATEPSSVPPLLPAGRPDAEARNGESMARRDRAHLTELLRAPALEQESGRADEPVTHTDTSDRNLTPQTTAQPSEAFGVAPRSNVTAPAAASAAISEGVRRSSTDALAPAIPAALAAQVRGDAAHRTGADPASIRIIAVESTAWPDAALGCDPRREHAQEALVPGYVVTVEAPGTTLRYHTDDRDRIAVCGDE